VILRTTHEPGPTTEQPKADEVRAARGAVQPPPQGDDGAAERSAPKPLSREALKRCALERRSVERRAVEAVNWGMPAVNYDLMRQAMLRDAGGQMNQVVYWSRPFDWKNRMLTPNPDVIYAMPFFDLTDVGPMVIEIPPAGDDGSITGTIMDCWQAPLEDVGPAGEDAGKGGKYVILPPGHSDTVPEGYFSLLCRNLEGYALLRSIPKSSSDEDVARAVAYAKRIGFYPLSQASAPPPTTFVDAIDVVFDSTIPYDIRFFQSLDRIVQHEPWLDRDKAMIDVLRTIGIEKGKPFQPDADRRAILASAAREAHECLDARYEDSFKPFYEGEHWSLPFLPELGETVPTGYEKADAYSVDARGLADTYAFSTVKHLGAGQAYLLTIEDADGNPLDGSNAYRLLVPANAPVKQYWSAVAYDRETHSLMRNVERPSRASLTPDLAKEPDGSIELVFAPIAPTVNANWIPTSPGERFEVMFRLYGPEPAFFDKSWRLPDIELL
jgi:hypothetical protein